MTTCQAKNDLVPREAIHFNEGLPGWPEQHEWELVRHPEADPFLWIRAQNRDGIALVVLDPRTLDPGYRPEIPDEVRRRLDLSPDDCPLFLSVVTLGANGEEATINLRAPIVINPTCMKGAQVVLEREGLSMAQPILTGDD
jgi:flagellar assembly factor FliW